MAEERVVVVGAGIVGLAVARQIARQRPGATVTVVEKEPLIGQHQSGHNSGVVHAGLYYEPGSLKARLCRHGVALLRDYCRERGIAYVERGKLVVALDDDERTRLRALHDRAVANGVPGLRLLDAAALREVEPHAAGVAAVHSPTTAVVDFPAVCRALAADLAALGGEVICEFPVTGIERRGARILVRSPERAVEADRVILCAGLHADRVARLAGDTVDRVIVPFRGEYYRLAPHRRHLVRGLIYPVPDSRYPFLGVHLTRRVDDVVEVGPNAVLALAREGYRRRRVCAADVREIVRSPGFRALARAHWKTGLHEMAGSWSTSVFVARARRYVPELRVDDVSPAPAGVRAQALDPDGSLVDDFRISVRGPVVAVRNAPSPAATSCLAIAEHVCARVP
ncbi:MAG: L-2-hydroxyglutarate oxidase [Mycobacterium leprae]